MALFKRSPKLGRPATNTLALAVQFSVGGCKAPASKNSRERCVFRMAFNLASRTHRDWTQDTIADVLWREGSDSATRRTRARTYPTWIGQTSRPPTPREFSILPLAPTRKGLEPPRNPWRSTSRTPERPPISPRALSQPVRLGRGTFSRVNGWHSPCGLIGQRPMSSRAQGKTK